MWFRPRGDYVARAYRVSFAAHLAGLQGAPGVYGKPGLTQHFRIGDSLIAVASTATHHSVTGDAVLACRGGSRLVAASAAR